MCVCVHLCHVCTGNVKCFVLLFMGRGKKFKSLTWEDPLRSGEEVAGDTMSPTRTVLSESIPVFTDSPQAPFLCLPPCPRPERWAFGSVSVLQLPEQGLATPLANHELPAGRLATPHHPLGTGSCTAAAAAPGVESEGQLRSLHSPMHWLSGAHSVPVAVWCHCPHDITDIRRTPQGGTEVRNEYLNFKGEETETPLEKG